MSHTETPTTTEDSLSTGVTLDQQCDFRKVIGGRTHECLKSPHPEAEGHYTRAIDEVAAMRAKKAARIEGATR